MDAITIVINPAAGPETPSLDPLKNPTTIPPITPAIKPANIFGKPSIPFKFVDAKPIPKHKGNATKNTTKPADKSLRQSLKNPFITQNLISN
jgi:hypothetical protein